MALKSLFFKKITKNRPPAGASPPDPPSVMRLSFTSLLTHVSQVTHLHFLAFG